MDDFIVGALRLLTWHRTVNKVRSTGVIQGAGVEEALGSREEEEGVYYKGETSQGTEGE